MRHPNTSLLQSGSFRRGPVVGAIELGGLVGFSNAFISILLLLLLRWFLPPSFWGNSAAASLVGQSDIMLFFVAVVVAPTLETLEAQLVPIELARAIGLSPLLCILLSAALFSVLHYFLGGLVHGITTFFGGLLLATTYIFLRPAGLRSSYLGVVIAHAVHNALLLYVASWLVPSLA